MKNISLDIQKMPQSQSTLMQHETANAQRTTATDEPVEKYCGEAWTSISRAEPHSCFLMKLQTEQQYKQKENRKESGQPFKKMTTILTSQHEDSKLSGQPYSMWHNARIIIKTYLVVYFKSAYRLLVFFSFIYDGYKLIRQRKPLPLGACTFLQLETFLQQTRRSASQHRQRPGPRITIPS